MIELLGSECDGHRTALLDFVDRREIGPGTRPALDHLDRCRSCEWELEATALAIAALRRMWSEASGLEPPEDAWSRLRARIDRPRGPLWRWRTSLGGLMVGAGLAAALVAPAGIWTRQPAVIQESGFDPAFSAALRLAEQRAESDWLRQQRLVRVIVVTPESAVRPTSLRGTGGLWRGPDGLGVTAIVLGTEPPAGRAD
jgi:hypothetical protein